jgi:glycosyltransferase involved in cell wall biosynthesis
MKELLFITQDYPFDQVEAAFIKSEIPYVSKIFTKVHILCLRKYKKKDNILNIPDNVSIHFINKRFYVIKRFFLVIILLFYPFFYKEILFLIKNKKFSIYTIFRAVSFLTNAIMLKGKIRQILNKYNYIILIYTYWYTAGVLGSLLLYKKNIKCITRAHGFDLYEFRNKQNYQPYKYWMDKRIEKIFFISQHGYDYYLSTFAGINKNKYMIAKLGIINKYKIKYKNESKKIFCLLSCSRIVKIKRLHLIIETLKEIDAYEINWIHFGDGELKNEIIKMAEIMLSNKKNISYNFMGYMSNEKIMQFYSEHYIDCFISTSESEGLPVSMMEAISFGIPIIATNVGGVSELVNKDIGILLNSSCCIIDIKKALIDFYNFPNDKKIFMRKSARQLWESNFNAEINYKIFSEEIVSLIE